jgi:hypothetical protein
MKVAHDKVRSDVKAAAASTPQVFTALGVPKIPESSAELASASSVHVLVSPEVLSVVSASIPEATPIFQQPILPSFMNAVNPILPSFTPAFVTPVNFAQSAQYGILPNFVPQAGFQQPTLPIATIQQ